ncbi:uncharacterized protein J4E88_006367 [Alternaria novae-zelandiae]|uniref:uncharacterized protein n=1 Tax=Alternaria novae-zelandiae TaxID=430562 RepID=UPI0020C4D8E6|nr:uncharacterized protein J4E88_006367 [Alternaria novae-zelandiae]KAI4679075.1 hypothetical protein J4E88_006367 [Alternaria novae-zelandiae]
MATDPRRQALDLLSGYSTPSNLLPEGYRESFDKSWYQEYVQYRESVKPKLGTNGPSCDWASDTYTAGRRSSLQLDDIAHETSANPTNCGGSLEETANALICIGAGVKSQDLAGTQNQYEQEQYEKKQHDEEQYKQSRRDEDIQRRFAEALRRQPAAKGKARRRGLPLLLESHGDMTEIMTCYDTGTHENHMSRAKAIELGYNIDPSPDIAAAFQLPNGKIIKAVGHVVVAVQFARREGPKASSMTCHFNVFDRLALPVLIGMTFLQATETITRYTSRMVDLPTTWKRSLRLCAVGNATNQVACTIDGRAVSAAADTGSEIALVSGEYAMKHGLLRDYSCEELELADGSLEYTSGHADVTVRVLTKEDVYCGNPWKTKKVRFHVLKNLQFDVILDEETIDDLSIFENGVAKIVAAASSIVPSISTIIHLGSVEASLTQASDTLGEKTKALCTSVQSKFNSIFSKPNFSPAPTTPENRRFDQIDKRGHPSAGDAAQKREYDTKIEQLSREIRNLKASQGP